MNHTIMRQIADSYGGDYCIVDGVPTLRLTSANTLDHHVVHLINEQVKLAKAKQTPFAVHIVDGDRSVPLFQYDSVTAVHNETCVGQDALKLNDNLDGWDFVPNGRIGGY